MQKSKNVSKMGGKDQIRECRSSSPVSSNLTLQKALLDISSEQKGTANVSISAESAEDNASSASSSGSSSGKGSCPGGNTRKKKYHHKRLQHASTTDTDENGSDVSSTLEREAPDGGWGWVVVGAAFFVNLIADGVTFSFGVFYTEFSQVFGESKGTTAWVGSLLAAMPLLSGPIASSLTDRFGCRKVTICGGLLAATGFILSYYANSIYVLMLTFGVITGFGLSLCYVAAVVIVAYYFERRRSFATGLSVCGGGIGTFLFAPLTQYLIDEYGWREAILILAGCFLNLCVCGALMRDLEWTKKSSKKRDKLLQNEHDFNTQAQQNLLTHGEHSLDGNASHALKSERLCNSALCIPTFVQEQERKNSRRTRYYSNTYGIATHTPGGEDDLKIVSNNKNKKASTNSNGTVVVTQNETEKDKKDTRDSSPSRTTLNNGCIVSNAHSNSCSPLPNNSNLINFNTSYLIKTHSNNSASNNNLNHSSSIVVNNAENGSLVNGGGGGGSLAGEPTAQQKQLAMKNYVVHHTRNFSGLARHRHSLTYRGAVLSLKRYRLRPASSCPDIISVATTDRSAHEWKAVLADIVVWMRGIFAWDNLSNTRFLLFIMSNFLLYTWYDIPYIFLSTYAEDVGYSKPQGAMLGSSIGICNVFGNIILGYIGDKKWANSILVYGICISICGGVTALMPYFMNVNYYLISTLCGLFGIMIAANYSLTPVILVKVVSLERFANAYGLLLLVQGLGNLIGPPLAGWLYDWTNTYTWSFLVAGGGIFVSNFFILAPIYNNSYSEEEKADNGDQEDSHA